jgi:hypothetical protein
MNRKATPISSCRSFSRFTISAWIDTSSADTLSSQTTKSGRETKRPGDADALPLPARKGVRKPPQVFEVELAARGDLAHPCVDPRCGSSSCPTRPAARR